MYYLFIFWVILVLFLIVFAISKLFKLSNLNKFLDNRGAVLFIIILIPILLISIITKDPISFGSYQIPTELQWLGSLFASFFGAWQFYLKPLKNKVFGMDREIGEIKTKINSIDSDVKTMKDFLINKKSN